MQGSMVINGRVDPARIGNVCFRWMGGCVMGDARMDSGIRGVTLLYLKW